MRRILAWGAATTIVLVCSIAGGAALGHQATVVQAAPAADGVVMCEKIATTGPTDFYYCETGYGNFFVNSVGFMVLEE